MNSLIYKLKLKYHYIITQLFYRPFFKKGGANVIIINPTLITPEFFIMESKVFIRNNARIEGIKSYENVNFNPRIIFQKNVSIEQNLHLTCATEIIIGENTSIANNVTITDIDHPYLNIDLPVERQPIISKSVFIGADSKIFSNAVILQGVTLGRHTVVAANSVVRSGKYPDYCVLAGTPARVVKLFDVQSNSWKSIK